MTHKKTFASDYLEGAHPAILEKLIETNMEQTAGYGLDPYSALAKEKIRQACQAPGAGVEFLVGGTQTNAIVINALLRSYQGVIAVDSGHIATHEAGAIEFGGNKVLTLTATMGKISAEQVEEYLIEFYKDEAHQHMVQPGMVYISQPTEMGTLYSLAELENLAAVCQRYKIPLFLDGARLAYALASQQNDIRLSDLARLCDVFYIGGTKCGAFFGEAVVLPNPELIPHFFTIIKQKGALLAKGRLLGIQFDTLFTDGLYERIGQEAVGAAMAIQAGLKSNGYDLLFEASANQVFAVVNQEQLDRLAEKIDFAVWEPYGPDKLVIRLTTSWATRAEDVAWFVDWLGFAASTD